MVRVIIILQYVVILGIYLKLTAVNAFDQAIPVKNET